MNWTLLRWQAERLVERIVDTTLGIAWIVAIVMITIVILPAAILRRIFGGKDE